MKTQNRIALAFFFITLSVMAVFSALIYYLSTQYTFSDFYKRLETRAVLASRIRFGSEDTSEPFRQMRENILEKLPGEIDYFFDIDATSLAHAADSLNVPRSFFEQIKNGSKAEFQKEAIFVVGIPFHHHGKSYAVVVAAENYYYSHHIANLRKVLIGSVIVTSLIVLSISFIFSRLVFEPVRQITRQVRDINTQNLHERLDETGLNDDVNELKATFNTMLDRLEAAFATQNNFISNASHELRTPLTAIMGETDVSLSKVRSENEYRETLTAISKQAERLDRIITSLLLLARTGFDGARQKFEDVRVDQLIWDVKNTIEQLNPRDKVVINMQLMPENPEMLKVKGNEHLLHLALTNIISNGCKYSKHQPVELSLGISEERVIIVIADKGIGIPDNEIGFIYDPFFRASNTVDFEGYGIGLPLTRNIVRMHKGTIKVDSTVNRGTVVQLIFPISR